MKNQKGVTLIALIITIIVMLILVVVTINIATTGGLIDKATDAKKLTQAEQINEKNKIDIASDEIEYASKERTIFDFTSTRSETYSSGGTDVNVTKTYPNLYVYPVPSGDERVTFAIIATATGDTEKEWNFDMDPGDNLFSIQTYMNQVENTIQVENYIYTPEEKVITLGTSTLTLTKGWSHNIFTATFGGQGLESLVDGTQDALSYSEVPVFTNAKFVTNKVPDETDGETAFDSIKDIINKYLSETPYIEYEQNENVNEIGNETVNEIINGI